MNVGSVNSVYDLAFDSSDNLYVGGNIDTAGGDINHLDQRITVNNIAKWDGTHWTSLGEGLKSSVQTIEFDSSGNLCVGGAFEYSGTERVNYIASWDGTSWKQMGNEINGFVNDLEKDSSGNLYATQPCLMWESAPKSVYRWNGEHWISIEMFEGADSLAVDSTGKIYVTDGRRWISWWDGTGWYSQNPHGKGVYPTVLSTSVINALTSDENGNIYAGGGFHAAGDVIANGIARFDGTHWHSLETGLGNYNGDYIHRHNIYVNDLVWDKKRGVLYVSGFFNIAGNIQANNIAMWNPAANNGAGGWFALKNGFTFTPNDLAIDSSGNLYALASGQVWRWNGSTWIQMGVIDNVSCTVLFVDNQDVVYVGGSPFNATSGVLRWSGFYWVPVGRWDSGEVNFLTKDLNGKLYATKNTNPYLGEMIYVLNEKYNFWEAVSSNAKGKVNILLPSGNGAFYVGGEFSFPGENTIHYLARWNPESGWETVGGDTNRRVNDLLLTQDGIFMGGNFTRAGNNDSYYIAHYTNVQPSLTNISPREVRANTPYFKLTLSGERFLSDTVVLWDGEAIPDTYVTSNTLIAKVPPAKLLSPGTSKIYVMNPGSGGGVSQELSIQILEDTSIRRYFPLMRP